MGEFYKLHRELSKYALKHFLIGIELYWPEKQKIVFKQFSTLNLEQTKTSRYDYMYRLTRKCSKLVDITSV